MPNAKMARRILNVIQKRPETFNMNTWIGQFDLDDVEVYNPVTDEYEVPEGVPTTLVLDLEFNSQDELITKNVDVCGTTLCVAGWAVALDGWKFERGSNYPSKGGEYFEGWIEIGRKILDLNWDDADDLFHTDETTAKRALQQLADGAEWIDWDKARSDDLSW